MLDLRNLHDERRVNRITGLDALVEQFEPGEMQAAYSRLRSQSPTRRLPDMPYVMETHLGTVPIGRPGTCSEKHLARALFNHGQPLRSEHESEISIIDYEFPLSESMDGGIGEADLLGVTTSGVLVVIELKIPGKGQAVGDTPLRAFFEALKYAAVIDANSTEIARQVESLIGRVVKTRPPNLLVAAPHLYWERWTTKKAAGDWIPPLTRLSRDVADLIGVSVGFVDLGPVDCDSPHGDQVRPFLTGRLEVTDAFTSRTRPMGT